MADKDPSKALQEITDLPVEGRYTWRVISAIRWAFADFDSATVQVDLDTLTEADKDKMIQDLDMRAAQLAILLKVIFGTAKMEQLMKDAMAIARGDGPKERVFFQP